MIWQSAYNKINKNSYLSIHFMENSEPKSLRINLNKEMFEFFGIFENPKGKAEYWYKLKNYSKLPKGIYYWKINKK